MGIGNSIPIIFSHTLWPIGSIETKWCLKQQVLTLVKSQVPPFTCLLFEGMQQTHGKWAPINIEWSKSNWNQLRSACISCRDKIGTYFLDFFFLNNFIIPVMCSTKPRLFVWWVKHYFYKRKVIGEVVDLRLWVHVQSLSFLNKKFCVTFIWLYLSPI